MRTHLTGAAKGKRFVQFTFSTIKGRIVCFRCFYHFYPRRKS